MEITDAFHSYLLAIPVHGADYGGRETMSGRAARRIGRVKSPEHLRPHFRAIRWPTPYGTRASVSRVENSNVRPSIPTGGPVGEEKLAPAITDRGMCNVQFSVVDERRRL